ncbi:ariadne RING finger, putative [Entamoeba invadens IP1]|uniref:RBR-type E3 ubiquitin transferase n=2 Tax=Entamoeba invadens TaxID=33085 RepID=A0A0A1UCT0_ENTIV|nr:ariadne RING finger, putative [Entamoeba invadens IP1]ELP90099.1 ariadne RING finger, putative [Entamoeba invadens IP1]BAN42163.1 ariadne RING finger, putative [Entamoeba invadens]|eukprot:XP_004256870.1 ariadne RING finger, putative [Entamoeba invadens IP1]
MDEETKQCIYKMYCDEYKDSIVSREKSKIEEEMKTQELLDKEHADREAVLQDKVYTCDICYEDVPASSVYIFDCDHHFCLGCAYDHIHTQIFNGVTDIRCPFSGCGHVISFEEIYQIIRNHEPYDKDLADRYERFLVNDYMKHEPNCRYCPKCGNAILGDPNTPEIFCRSEECKKVNFRFCFNCKEAWHEGLTCAQYQEWKRMNCEADKRFLSWAQKNTRKCPKCSATIEKNRGCNHMTCANCGYQFCWLCMAPYTSNHFRNGKCKQYS